jgi:hypothetical protein
MTTALATMSFVIATPFLAYCGILAYRMFRYLNGSVEVEGTVEDLVSDMIIAFAVGMFCITTGIVALTIKFRPVSSKPRQT